MNTTRWKSVQAFLLPFKIKAVLLQTEEKVKGCKYFLNARQAYSSFPIITGSAGTHAAADPQRRCQVWKRPFTHIPSTLALLWLPNASALRPEKKKECARGTRWDRRGSAQQRVGKHVKSLALYGWGKDITLHAALTLWSFATNRRQAAPTVWGSLFHPHANTCPVCCVSLHHGRTQLVVM